MFIYPRRAGWHLTMVFVLIGLLMVGCGRGTGAGRSSGSQIDVQRPEGASRGSDGQKAVALPTRQATANLPSLAGHVTRPASLNLTPPSLPALTPQNVPAVTVELPGSLQGITPQITLAVTAVSAQDAQQLLVEAIRSLKNQSVRVTGAKGYSGSANVAVPAPFEEMLQVALSGGASVYLGLYQGTSQAVYASLNGSSDDLTLLIEPQRSVPSSADEAQALLATLFPLAVLTQALPEPAIPDGSATVDYLWYGQSGNSVFLGGIVRAQGLTLAFGCAAHGELATALPFVP